jgi:hypothetical protein
VPEQIEVGKIETHWERFLLIPRRLASATAH